MSNVSLLQEIAADFLTIDENILRTPYYPPETWLMLHGGSNVEVYMDWLLLQGGFKRQLEDDGYIVEEVPLLTSQKAQWEGRIGTYICGISRTEVNELKREVKFRLETPIEEATMWASYYLPLLFDDQTLSGPIRYLSRVIDEDALMNISSQICTRYHLDLDYKALSEFRSRGVAIRVWPRLVSSLDFDDGFGERCSEWLRTLVTGTAGKRPSVPVLRKMHLPYVGLVVSIYGEAGMVNRPTAFGLNSVDCTLVEREIIRSLGINDCEASTDFLTVGSAIEGNVEFIDMDDDGDTDDYSDESVDEPYIFADFVQRNVTSGPETPNKETKSRGGVVIPFVSKNREKQ